MTNLAFSDNAGRHALLHGTMTGRENLRRRLAEWRRRYVERRGLARLLSEGGVVLDRDLQDLGISRAQLRFEAAKPFWRA